MEVEKKEFNLMKHNLEKFREIILFFNSILKWDQQYYAGVIFAVISFVFLFIYYMDLSFITCFGLCGIFATLFDYFYPKLSKYFKSENWCGEQEKKFEEATKDILHIKSVIQSVYHTICNAKTEKSTLFLIATSTCCVILIWFGSTMNNLLLLYLTTLVTALFPGLLRHGYLDVVISKIPYNFGGSVKKEN